MNHRSEEEATGRDIWPATPKPALSKNNVEEVEFCNQLDCATGEGAKDLAW